MKFATFFRLILLCSCCLHPAVSAAQQQTILVFGDSLSAAYGMPREAGWVSLLEQDLLHSHPHYRIVNASISGETTAGGRQRIAAVLRKHRPAIVILELGANDGLRGTPVANIEANLKAIIEQSIKARAKILLLGIQLPPNYGVKYTADFKAIYPKLARQYKSALIPYFLEGLTRQQFQPDNLHPAAVAQKKILETVWLKLRPML